jgi:4-hydroxythreonine-4-phosphate dehydrogenase
MGDPAGIGPEIIVKALSHAEIYGICIPVVIIDGAILDEAIHMTGSGLKPNRVVTMNDCKKEYGYIDFIDLNYFKKDLPPQGVVSAVCGDAAFYSITEAIKYSMNGFADAVVTAPINKEALHSAGHNFAGHTEIFAHYTGTDEYAMMLMSGNLRVIHCTTHVSMKDACALITKERVYKTIKLAETAAFEMGLKDYTIGVAGFNPHCSENGLFGSEEADAIIPAVKAAQTEGIHIEGPIPADTIFVKAISGKYDIVVAMYHDQGHIPLKLNGFKMDPVTGRFTSVSGINVTVGLPIIRTSIDHGTAFDIAGRNLASEDSMTDAIKLASVMAENKRRQGEISC